MRGIKLFFSKKERERVKEQQEKEKISAQLRDNAELGNYEIVEQLVEKYGKDSDVINSPRRMENYMPGATALMLAVESGSAKTVQALLKASCINPYSADYSHNMCTVLMLAVYSKNLDMVKLIAGVEGLRADTRNGNGDTALAIAVRLFPEAVPYILKMPGMYLNNHMPQGTILHQAIQRREIEIIHGGESKDKLSAYIECLLDAEGIDLNIQDKEKGWTPLMNAAQYGDSALVCALIARGVNPGIRSYNKSQTAEDIARTSRHSEIADMLHAASLHVSRKLGFSS